MPQIWLTYDELGVLMDCDPAGARNAAAAIGLDRRRSRDGYTRAKLTPSLIEAFLDGVLQRRLDREVAACADSLHILSEQMSDRTAKTARPRAAAAG